MQGNPSRPKGAPANADPMSCNQDLPSSTCRNQGTSRAIYVIVRVVPLGAAHLCGNVVVRVAHRSTQTIHTQARNVLLWLPPTAGAA